MSPNPSSRNPGLMIAIVISMFLALGAGAYVLMRPDSTSSFLPIGSGDAKYEGVPIFSSIEINTSSSTTDPESGYTYLGNQASEIGYCTKFDEDTDGANAADLTDPLISQKITDTVGASISTDVRIVLQDIMTIDDGLLTDLCNYQGSIYALILSSDLQTMTPYIVIVENDGYVAQAYDPILTPGGYGSIFFNYVLDTVLIGTGHYQDEQEKILEWKYYALDKNNGATDLIESCEREATGEMITLTCSREYQP